MGVTITAKPDREGFRLYIDGEVAGPRLYKGDPFPFREERWWIQPDASKAAVACAKLKTYLDKREIELQKTK